MRLFLHDGDLPDGYDPGDCVAIDCETMGLRHGRDRLCLAQVSRGDGAADLVRVPKGRSPAPNLARILADPEVQKLFHFGRFDIAALYLRYGVLARPVYCTRIASYFARTFSNRHSLRHLCSELLGIEIEKEEQTSDWGAEELTDRQLRYAANDVLHLHAIRAELEAALAREGRTEYVRRCCEFLPWRAQMDVAGWDRIDLFAHGSGGS